MGDAFLFQRPQERFDVFDQFLVIGEDMPFLVLPDDSGQSKTVTDPIDVIVVETGLLVVEELGNCLFRALVRTGPVCVTVASVFNTTAVHMTASLRILTAAPRSMCL